MSNRYVVLATVVTVVLVTGYQLRQLEAPAGPAGARLPAASPRVEAPPALQMGRPGKSSIASLEVWNLKPTAMPGLPPLKEMFKAFYTLNRSGRFETVLRSDRPTEQWQFQGVLVRDGVFRALFYNPGLKKLRNLGRGELVDDRLCGLDGVVHRREDRGDLALLGEGWNQYA